MTKNALKCMLPAQFVLKPIMLLLCGIVIAVGIFLLLLNFPILYIQHMTLNLLVSFHVAYSVALNCIKMTWWFKDDCVVFLFDIFTVLRQQYRALPRFVLTVLHNVNFSETRGRLPLCSINFIKMTMCCKSLRSSSSSSFTLYKYVPSNRFS